MSFKKFSAQFVVAMLCLPATAQAVELPAAITPAIREACESDVRRLCIGPTSTQATVRYCVLRKLDQLNGACRQRLSDAGLVPAVGEKPRSE